MVKLVYKVDMFHLYPKGKKFLWSHAQKQLGLYEE